VSRLFEFKFSQKNRVAENPYKPLQKQYFLKSCKSHKITFWQKHGLEITETPYKTIQKQRNLEDHGNAKSEHSHNTATENTPARKPL